MRLTDEEQRMYDGERGPTVAQAMDYLVRFGEACDSDSMVDISYAHVDSGMLGGPSDIHDVPELAAAGARVVIPTTTEIVATDMEQWQIIGTPEEYAQQQISMIHAHNKMGTAGTYTCTPYLLGYLPPKGAHIASIESSAVIYFNSMLGARSNRDGPFAIYAAMTGKYPLCGYHLNENRKGTHLIRVETKLTGPTDYGALGFCIGEIVGGGVPVVTGLTSPRQEELIAIGAAMATSGQIALYHIPGVTAECRTPEEVFAKGASYDEFSIDTNDIRKVYEELFTAKSDTVDFVHLGCPHYNLEQVRQVAVLLNGRKVHKDVKLWVSTDRGTKAMANLMGYLNVIRDAGGQVFCDTCGTVALPLTRRRPAVSSMITDSVKQAKYALEAIGCTTILAKLEDCIEAAMTGKGVY